VEPIENEGERTSKRVHGQSCDRATGRNSDSEEMCRAFGGCD
jgi:hypothetical protein